MPSLPSSHSVIQLCPSSDFSGSKTKARVAEFLFSHWKNSGLIFPNCLLSSLFGDFGFSRGTRTVAWYCLVWDSNLSGCVSAIYPPQVIMAHMPLRGLCRRLGGAGEGSLYPLVCPEAPATCGFGPSPNHIPGGGLFGDIPLRTWPLPLEDSLNLGVS